MSKTISCTVPNSTKAEEVISRLQSANFANSEISVLFAENKDGKVILEKNTKAPEGAATGGGTGAVIGGVLGWLIGIGSLAIPGVGPFIAAGPIMAALSGGAVGGVVGGILGSLVGLGIPEVEAKQYESKIKAGHTLISVHTESEDKIKRAREIFKEAGAEHVSETTALAA
jgi:uncharacterized membrane protein